MPDLAKSILSYVPHGGKVEKQVPKHVGDLVFDRLWVITLNDRGEATFTNNSQKLLFGDSME